MRADFILEHLSHLLLQPLLPNHFSPVGGGSINQVYHINAPDGASYCCKINSAAEFPHLFEAEAAGLAQLAPYIAVPKEAACTECAGQQILLMDWIKTKPPDAAFWKAFGEALARLHSIKGKHFGNAINNYMGAVPQINTYSHNWASFFAQQRIEPLVETCCAKNLLNANDAAAIEKLLQRLPLFFDDEKPSLLHGDLWSGNFLCSAANEPVLIDPAVYYGHPAVDLGMTTLFGGFDAPFYEAYRHYAPLPTNYKEQWELCNLYPLLIHLLLFGKSYLSGIRQITQKFM